jgi:hypothetical protein
MDAESSIGAPWRLVSLKIVGGEGRKLEMVEDRECSDKESDQPDGDVLDARLMRCESALGEDAFVSELLGEAHDVYGWPVVSVILPMVEAWILLGVGREESSEQGVESITDEKEISPDFEDLRHETSLAEGVQYSRVSLILRKGAFGRVEVARRRSVTHR